MSEGAAAAAAAAAPPVRAVRLRPSLATLLAGHILRDGEVVQLIVKPSLWFVVLNGMRFHAAVLIGLIWGQLALHEHEAAARSVAEIAVVLIAGRLTWSILQWMGRLYVLTDYRILRLAGVFNIDVFDLALRRVADTRMTRTFCERLLRLGSIEITPVGDGSAQPGIWQTIRKPNEVLAKVRATIDRAKQGDCNLI
jgi:uncharacterized membrane protein YdbT with pleckstrin-like domain